jgi:hypothetical protein
MERGNVEWLGALLATLSIVACSSSNKSGVVGDGNPMSTGGVPAGSGGSGGVPTTVGAVQGVAGKSGAAAAGTGNAAAGKTGGGTAGTTASAAGAAAAGTSGATSGAGGAAGSPPVGVACNPADKKPDPMKVPFTSIPGYQSMTKEPTTGPAKPVLEADPGLPMWTVYRPDDLGNGESTHAILAWANGGCLQNGTLYGQWLLELASWGFVVVADGAPQAADADPAAGGIRSNGDGMPQNMALDWITAENERPCSQYYHKLDVTKLAVAGQSCGGIMSLMAADDKRIATAIIFNSGLFSPDQTVYSGLHAPMAYFIGGMSDVAYSNAESDVSMINNVPLFYGNLDVGHGATWMDTNAGEFGRVGLGWLKWQLNGDTTAKSMFSGADCELCKPPSMWVVKKKMMD